jgi:hypothetical protein
VFEAPPVPVNSDVLLGWLELFEELLLLRLPALLGPVANAIPIVTDEEEMNCDCNIRGA